MTIGEDGTETFASEATAPMNNARWYFTGVSLPTGEVITFSGADRDEVVAPGSGTPETTPELYDPETGTWTELADAAKGRTYHNTAPLLGDGRVLVGGHAPIATGYAKPTPELEALGLSQATRDPSFEVFSPPNLFHGPRPVITRVDPSVQRGATLRIATPDAADISSVTIVRNTAMTHLVDADQRTVELPVVGRDGGSVTVAVTESSAVLPDGPYFLFANRQYEQGETPSVGRQVFVGEVPAALADDVRAEHVRTLGAELQAREAAAPGAGSAPAAAAPLTAPAPAAPAPAAAPATSTGTAAVVPAVAVTSRLAASARSLSSAGLPAGPVLAAALLLTGAVGLRRWALRS